MKANKAYEIITDRILEALSKGVIPWRKMWQLPAGTRPQNAISHKAYRGINPFMLELAGYADPRWLTYRQAKAKGGYIRAGEQAMPVTFAKPMTRDTDKKDAEGKTITKTFFFLRYYNVFNVEQTEGIEWEPMFTGEVEAFDPITEAEAIVRGMPNPPEMNYGGGGDQAYYVPATDAIYLPPVEAFGKNADEYYSVAFHELGHSTGHSSRLDRHDMETGIAPFGSETYSREELVAEFTSAFLCNESGIQNQDVFKNSAAYIQNWSRKLKKDKKLVVQAASLGQKSADYILGGE